MIISDIIKHHALRSPHREAVICGGRRLTYRVLQDRMYRLANAFLGLGIEHGDHVALLCTNRAEHIEVTFALAAIGAVWVPLNFRLTPPELAYIVSDAKAKMVVYSTDLAPVAEQLNGLAESVDHWLAIGDGPGPSRRYEGLLSSASSSAPEVLVASGDLAAILYTSGTTGKPKGAMLTHGQLLHGAVNIALEGGARSSEITLQVIPQFHAGGNCTQLAQMLVGSPIVIAPRFEPELVLSLVRQEQVSYICFVPSMLIFLIEEPALERSERSTLTRIMYGGSTIPGDRLERALDLFSAGFQQVYGQTEAGVLSALLDEQDHRDALTGAGAHLRASCGREVIGFQMSIARENGSEAADGEVGEIRIRGDSLMSGYWQREKETAHALRNGWLNTGDLGRRDGEGYFYVVDRKIDMVVTGGENVYPVEVEDVISSHPAVLEAAVIGVPDARWVEAVTAVVVLRPGANAKAADIVAHCRRQLAGFKTPKQVLFADALPRTPSGKIKKNELRVRFRPPI